MSSKRRRFSGELKAKVALEALRGERTLQEIAAQYQVHPNQVGAWKRQAVEGLAEVLSKGAERRTRDHESEELCCKLGEGAMRDQGASCSPYVSALARRSRPCENVIEFRFSSKSA